MNITPRDLEDVFYSSCLEEHLRQRDISKPVIQEKVRMYGWRKSGALMIDECVRICEEMARGSEYSADGETFQHEDSADMQKCADALRKFREHFASDTLGLVPTDTAVERKGDGDGI